MREKSGENSKWMVEEEENKIKRTREVVVLWGGCDPIVVVLPCVYTQTR